MLVLSRLRRSALAFAIAIMGSATTFAGNPSNPILFVTQVPMPEEVNSRSVVQSYMSCVSPFSNHLGDTAHAGRGGSLYIRFTDGQVVDLLASADWSQIPGGRPANNTIAVRNPSVHYLGNRAIFSMVVGAPSGPSDTTVFLWQLYEITLPTQAQLGAGTRPVLTKVSNQPGYNNVFPTYAPNGLVVFASDRPYNGQAHLLQREEYLGLPTTSGLWVIDPTDAASLRLLHHSPSGSFYPSVDRAGRVVFSNWDHLSRDPQAVTDSRNGIMAAPYNELFTQTFNGSGNFADETLGSGFTAVTAMPPDSWEIFPEPRNFDRRALIDVFNNTINGNSHNIFLPWTVNLDGTGGEILNHVGRHEIAGAFNRNFRNDTALADFNPGQNLNYGGLVPHNFVINFLSPHEDPRAPGQYFGVDGADLGTHGAGQIVRLNNAGTVNGRPTNPDAITVTYITSGANGAAKPAIVPTVRGSMNLPPTGQSPLTAGNAETLYRTPVPLADGNLVASVSPNVVQTDYNTGTVSAPQSMYTFRLVSLRQSGSTFVQDINLTSGINLNTSYYVGSTLVSYNGPAWELDPVEVVSSQPPVPAQSSVDPIKAQVFRTVGVHIPTFQNYLRSHNAALTVSRDVTRRDIHDRQQPYNLRVTWSNRQAIGGPGQVYDIAWMQILQADLRRGYLLGGASPAPGRRVIATPMHDTMSENVLTPGAPSGSVRIGDDGSVAAIIPAGKALSWQLLNNDSNFTSQIRERFWVTFQPGEVRTCPNCHGINTSDQTGTIANPVSVPTNPPLALASLLQAWQLTHPAGTVQHASGDQIVPYNIGMVNVSVARVGGSTGPCSVDYSTTDGTALSGVDYTASAGTLNWADGDTTNKSFTIAITGNTTAATANFTVVLRNAQYATLGVPPSVNITIQGPGSVDGGMPMDVVTDVPSDLATDSPSDSLDVVSPQDGTVDTGTPDTSTADSGNTDATNEASSDIGADTVGGTNPTCACSTTPTRSRPLGISFAMLGTVIFAVVTRWRRTATKLSHRNKQA